MAQGNFPLSVSPGTEDTKEVRPTGYINPKPQSEILSKGDMKQTHTAIDLLPTEVN